MEMKRVNSGKLRAIGYAARERLLRVELDDGRVVEHSGVSEEVWRRLSGSSSAWSYYRDNIEEEYAGRAGAKAAVAGAARPNPLDELFGK
ncbi:KTSC domain-containing protein [Azoarcus indigens]|uniref:KTSC domain-containing protein n=1 Tax=Azoarcus indigens TaxID=29545 RepID=A0A4R6DZS4_9RHOO|nr:KTSC domain-containing protein [Azoarcus indigens]NMG64718.1 KTSC domain-containing protein [Azoarcus indigens]TDN50897.1 KTSC domain-containing protein [Azoarcus indigens]